MEFKVIDMEIPDEANIILGQTHFINYFCAQNKIWSCFL